MLAKRLVLAEREVVEWLSQRNLLPSPDVVARAAAHPDGLGWLERSLQALEGERLFVADELSTVKTGERSGGLVAALERLERRLAEGEQDLASLKALFSDRSDGIYSLNRYPEDDRGTATNSVVLAIPARRELWACRGPADRGVWQQLRFDTPA